MVLTERFVYFGSAEFSRLILRRLLKVNWRPVLVVTTEAKPAGRGLKLKRSAVAEETTAAGLPLVAVSTLRGDLPSQLKEVSADFAILAAFGKILPPALLQLYPRGIINLHPSLLPLYRGPSPIQYAILDGVERTGVTLIKLDEEVDHGPILAQASCLVDNKDAAQLTYELAVIGADLVCEKIPLYLAGALTPVPQNHSLATFTKIITKEDGRADFSLSAEVLNRRRRAFTPWPGLWTTWQGKILKFTQTEVVVNTNSQPGLVVGSGKELLIGCGHQTALLIKKLQLAGGKEQKAESFINGHPNLLGVKLPN